MCTFQFASPNICMVTTCVLPMISPLSPYLPFPLFSFSLLPLPPSPLPPSPLPLLSSIQGSGSNVDLCIITADKTEYLRPYDVANNKGTR